MLKSDTDFDRSSTVSVNQATRMMQRLKDLTVVTAVDPETKSQLIASLDPLPKFLGTQTLFGATERNSLNLLRSSSNSSLDVTSKVTSVLAIKSVADQTHAFFASSDESTCQYCLLDHNLDDQIYSCGCCKYTCHKTCRPFINVSCIDQTKQAEQSPLVLSKLNKANSDSIRQVTAKIGALQTEIDIELKLRDGIEKMIRASSGGSKKRRQSVQNDKALLLNQANNKIQILKNGLQKTQAELQILQRSRDDEMLLTSPSDMQVGGGLISVSYHDQVSKSDSTKMVYMSMQSTCDEVIEKIIEKLNLSGVSTQYSLLYHTDSDKDSNSC
jgi:hypothetical protein